MNWWMDDRNRQKEMSRLKREIATETRIEAAALDFAQEKGVTYEWEIFTHLKENGFSVTIAKFRPVFDDLCRRNIFLGIKTGDKATSKVIYTLKKGKLFDIEEPYIQLHEFIELFKAQTRNGDSNNNGKIVIGEEELKEANAELFKEVLVKQHFDDMDVKTAFITALANANAGTKKSEENGTGEEDEKLNISLNGFTTEELQYISERHLLNGTDPDEFINNLIKSAIRNATSGKLEIEQNGEINVTEMVNMIGGAISLLQRR